MEVYHASTVVADKPNSDMLQLLEDGIADLHCRSDKYLAEEVWDEKRSPCR